MKNRKHSLQKISFFLFSVTFLNYILLVFYSGKRNILFKIANSDYYFSIVVPFHNRENYIVRAINSIITQNFENFQIVFIDDVSTDNTSKIIRSYMEKDDRFWMYEMKDRLGTNEVRMFGVQHSTGKYILQLDSDDEFTPNLFQDLIDANPNDIHDIIFFDALVYFSPIKNGSWHHRVPRREHFNKTELINEVKKGKINWNLIFMSIRRSIYLKAIKLIRPYLTDTKICVQEDRLQAHTCFLFCNSFLHLKKIGYIYYRDHISAISRRNMKVCNGERESKQILRQIYWDHADNPPN